MSCRKIKTGWLIAFAIAIAAHAGGFWLFSFREPPRSEHVTKAGRLEFIDLNLPENILILETALFNDQASLFQPTEISFTEEKPYRLDDLLLEQSAGEIAPRLSLGPTSEMVIEVSSARSANLSTFSEARTVSVLRPLGQRDRPPQVALQPKVTISFVSGSNHSSTTKGLKETLRVPSPEDLGSDEIWRPLLLGLWIDPTGAIPRPLIEESTGDDDRDQALIELLLREIQSLTIAPGYYTVIIGI